MGTQNRGDTLVLSKRKGSVHTMFIDKENWKENERSPFQPSWDHVQNKVKTPA